MSCVVSVQVSLPHGAVGCSTVMRDIVEFPNHTHVLFKKMPDFV